MYLEKWNNKMISSYCVDYEIVLTNIPMTVEVDSSVKNFVVYVLWGKKHGSFSSYFFLPDSLKCTPQILWFLVGHHLLNFPEDPTRFTLLTHSLHVLASLGKPCQETLRLDLVLFLQPGTQHTVPNDPFFCLTFMIKYGTLI
jgi:hypothetical protein